MIYKVELTTADKDAETWECEEGAAESSRLQDLGGGVCFWPLQSSQASSTRWSVHPSPLIAAACVPCM